MERRSGGRQVPLLDLGLDEGDVGPRVVAVNQLGPFQRLDDRRPVPEQPGHPGELEARVRLLEQGMGLMRENMDEVMGDVRALKELAWAVNQPEPEPAPDLSSLRQAQDRIQERWSVVPPANKEQRPRLADLEVYEDDPELESQAANQRSGDEAWAREEARRKR